MSKAIFDFTGENFVVTGGSSGMGRRITIELAESGANVLAIARGRERLSNLQELCPEKISIASVDVCDMDGMALAIKDFVASKGKLSGAVHAAGIVALTPLKAYDIELARKIMDISYWGGVNLLQVCTKARISEAGASFVLFSSVRTEKTDKGLFAYAGAKSALKTVARSFANEMAHRKIRINTVSPGFVVTDMTERLDEVHNLAEVHDNTVLGAGSPEDVSPAVLFLLSDGARWITGTDIVIDGGYLA